MYSAPLSYESGFLNLSMIDIPGQTTVVGAVLCAIGCLAVSLASTQQMPISKCLRMLSNVPWLTTTAESDFLQLTPLLA